MGLKLEINKNNFIFENKEYPIIETFIDFIVSFGNGLYEKIPELLIDLKSSNNKSEYYSYIKEKNFSIFYLPDLIIPDFDDKNDFNYWIEDKILESDYFSDYISRYNQAIDICFNLSDKRYKDLTFNQRYALCLYSKLLPKSSYTTKTYLQSNYPSDVYTLFDDNIDNNYEIIKKMNEPNLIKYISI